MWFEIVYHGPRFTRHFTSVAEAKKWAERYTPLRRGWSMAWTYSRESGWWVLTVTNSKGHKVNDVGLRKVADPKEQQRRRCNCGGSHASNLSEEDARDIARILFAVHQRRAAAESAATDADDLAVRLEALKNKGPSPTRQGPYEARSATGSTVHLTTDSLPGYSLCGRRVVRAGLGNGRINRCQECLRRMEL